MSPLRKAPITAACILICMALFSVCTARNLEGLRFRDAQRAWGAAATLQLFNVRDQQREAVAPELFGPFDLWDGEWWRLPVSAFHHANAVHLLLNCAAAWILGKRLEQRWGSGLYALFLVPAIFIPLLAEFVIGHMAIGFSGVICAVFGALIALQRFQPQDDDFPESFVQLNVGLLLLGIPLTLLGLMNIANLAHFSGLAYGWIAAWVWYGPVQNAIAIRAGFVVAHLAVLPAMWLVTHPVNNGRYLWYMADHHVAPPRREKMLRLAVEVDPELTTVWMRLADHHAIEGDAIGSWNLLVEALSYNPTNRELIEAARRVWRRLALGSERETAEQELQRVFGEQAENWSRQIRQTNLITSSDDAVVKTPNEPKLDPAQFPLDRPVDLNLPPQRFPANEPAPAVDPAAPNSAVEGTTL